MSWLKIKSWFIEYNTLLFLIFIAIGWLLSWVSVMIFAAIFLK